MDTTKSKIINLPGKVYISEDDIIAMFKTSLAEEPYEDDDGTCKSWEKDEEIIGKCRLPMVPHIFSTVYPFCTEGQTTNGFFLNVTVARLMAEKLGLDELKTQHAMLHIYNYQLDDPADSFIDEADILTGITAVKQVPYSTYQEFTDANKDDCLYKETISKCVKSLLSWVKLESMTSNKEAARFCVDLWKVCVLSYGWSNAAPIFQENGIDISKVSGFYKS